MYFIVQQSHIRSQGLFPLSDAFYYTCSSHKIKLKVSLHVCTWCDFETVQCLLAWLSNYIDKVTDIIQAKLLGDFHMVISMGGESLQTGGRVQQRGEI